MSDENKNSNQEQSENEEEISPDNFANSYYSENPKVINTPNKISENPIDKIKKNEINETKPEFSAETPKINSTKVTPKAPSNNSKPLKENNNETSNQSEEIESEDSLPIEQKIELVKFLYDLRKNSEDQDELILGLEELKQKKTLGTLINQEDGPSEDLIQELKNASSNSELEKILKKLAEKGPKKSLYSYLEDLAKKKLEQLSLEELNDLLAKTTDEKLRNNILALLSRKKVQTPKKDVEEAKEIAKKGLLPKIPDNTPYSTISNQKPSIPKNLKEDQEENIEDTDLNKIESTPQTEENKINPAEKTSEKTENNEEEPKNDLTDEAKEITKKVIKSLLLRIFIYPPTCFITWTIIFFISIIGVVIFFGSVITNCVVNFDVQSEQCSSLTAAVVDDVKKSILNSVGVTGDELNKKISEMTNTTNETPTDAARSDSGVPNPSA